MRFLYPGMIACMEWIRQTQRWCRPNSDELTRHAPKHEVKWWTQTTVIMVLL